VRGAAASPTEFSAYRAKSILQDLVGDGVPHPIGSPADARVRERILQRLSAIGYAPELQSGFVCNSQGVCGSPVNIVATLGGSSEDKGAVLLAAHYDSVPAGPGASDDGAGVATVLEIARILTALPRPRRPVVLLLTDGEEAGLLGALLFVREHPLSKQVLAAVNLEARGTSGPSLMFETGTANNWLMPLPRASIRYRARASQEAPPSPSTPSLRRLRLPPRNWYRWGTPHRRRHRSPQRHLNRVPHPLISNSACAPRAVPRRPSSSFRQAHRSRR
jgi:hypothetical protein